MGMEELCINKLLLAMNAIKNGSKTPKDAECGKYFKKLKELNEPMYEDMLKDYKVILESIKK